MEYDSWHAVFLALDSGFSIIFSLLRLMAHAMVSICHSFYQHVLSNHNKIKRKCDCMPCNWSFNVPIFFHLRLFRMCYDMASCRFITIYYDARWNLMFFFPAPTNVSWVTRCLDQSRTWRFHAVINCARKKKSSAYNSIWFRFISTQRDVFALTWSIVKNVI